MQSLQDSFRDGRPIPPCSVGPRKRTSYCQVVPLLQLGSWSPVSESVSNWLTRSPCHPATIQHLHISWDKYLFSLNCWNVGSNMVAKCSRWYDHRCASGSADITRKTCTVPYTAGCVVFTLTGAKGPYTYRYTRAVMIFFIILVTLACQFISTIQNICRLNWNWVGHISGFQTFLCGAYLTYTKPEPNMFGS